VVIGSAPIYAAPEMAVATESLINNTPLTLQSNPMFPLSSVPVVCPIPASFTTSVGKHATGFWGHLSEMRGSLEWIAADKHAQRYSKNLRHCRNANFSTRT
jgi:hypothetical protein